MKYFKKLGIKEADVWFANKWCIVAVISAESLPAFLPAGLVTIAVLLRRYSLSAHSQLSQYSRSQHSTLCLCLAYLVTMYLISAAWHKNKSTFSPWGSLRKAAKQRLYIGTRCDHPPHLPTKRTFLLLCEEPHFVT